MLLIVLASWIHREQQEVIDYLRTENRVLLEKLGKKRILLNDDQRRRLAVKGKLLGHKRLQEVGTLFTPDTILRWHRMVVAKKWDYSDRRKKPNGRPATSEEIQQLVVRMARENPSWGYDRIQGSLANLGHHVSDQTIGNVVKAHGIEPAPCRQRTTSWETFLKAHWDVLAAIDFTTVEVWTKGGLVSYYLLFVMHVATRRVHLAACTSTLGDSVMKQVARNLTDPFDGFLTDRKAVLMDRDAHFSAAFRAVLHEAGIQPVRLPPKSPNLNAHLERFHLSIKSECLSKMIFFGERSLRRAIIAYLKHYHEARNHQGLDNQLIQPGQEVGRVIGEIRCRQQLGGMLKYYYRDAA